MAIPPKPRASAVKLYAWLAYRGTYVQADVAAIMNGIGLFEGAVVNARKRLLEGGLIEADFKPGRGAIYGHTILNLKTRQPLDWAHCPSYFQVPHCLMVKHQYVDLSGSALLVYLAVLALVNKSGRHMQPLTAELLAKRASMSLPTIRGVLNELTDNSGPLLRVAPREVEIVHPETGQTLPEIDADGENLVFLEAHSGKRVGMNELLTPDNFTRYFCQELPDMDFRVDQRDVRCPFHTDNTPSMSVNTESGLWFCHACDVGGGMLQFEMRLLGLEDTRTAWHYIGRKLGLTLRSRKLGPPTSEHVWRDAEGEVSFVMRRYAGGAARPYRPVAGQLRMKVGMGAAKSTRSFYNLPDVLAARTVVIVEGETKADPLALLGLRDANGKDVAITTTGSANSWRSDFVEMLKGKRILLLPDTDEAGIKYAEAIQASLGRAGIEHETVYLDGYKDVRRFLEYNTPQALAERIGNDWIQLPKEQLPAVVGSIEDI
jgi:hypothetical protein